MDNQTHNPESAWVDSKLANLVPPGDWYPDSKRAYAQFLNRRDGKERESSSSWVRLSMAAAILASIGVVVALLPWQALWKPAAKSVEIRLKMPEPAKASSPIAASEPIQQKTSTPALSQPTLSPPRVSGPGRGAGVTQIARAAQEPEQKPAERVGPGVTPPRVISSPEPSYTDDARQAHIQGTVILGVIIRVDGTGKVEQVIQSLDPGLDKKAIEIFEKWRFTPAMKDGKPVDVQLQVTINFHLY